MEGNEPVMEKVIHDQIALIFCSTVCRPTWQIEFTLLIHA